MIEITALGMGLIMTAVAVAIAGLMLEATFLMLSRSLRVPTLAASFEPTDIHLSPAERGVEVQNVSGEPSLEIITNC